MCFKSLRVTVIIRIVNNHCSCAGDPTPQTEIATLCLRLLNNCLRRVGPPAQSCQKGVDYTRGLQVTVLNGIHDLKKLGIDFSK